MLTLKVITQYSLTVPQHPELPAVKWTASIVRPCTMAGDKLTFGCAYSGRPLLGLALPCKSIPGGISLARGAAIPRRQ